MNYKRTTLQNGLRLITTHMPGMRSASIVFLFTVGSRYEQEQMAGVSHFIEHMLFKGSQRYPSARLISETIEGVGGVFNAGTDKEFTSYTARVPGEYLSVVLNVLADMVRHPLFDPAEIEKERRVIMEELSATQDDPGEWVSLLIDEAMWPDLPLGRDIGGTMETVAQLQRQQMLAHLDTYYRPNSLVISIAGNIDPQQTIQLTEDLFHGWKAGDLPRYSENMPLRQASQIRLIQKETEQTNLCLATIGRSYMAPDYHAFLLVNSLLGEGMSSRLFQSIREEQGLAYHIESYTNSYSETGSLVVSAGVDPSQTDKAIKAIVTELTRLMREPVPADELDRIKAYVRGGYVLGLEGTRQVAAWLGSQECMYNRIRSVEEVIADIDAVTAEDIQHVAQTCFTPELRRLAIIGPDDTHRADYFGKLLTGV